MPDNPTYAQLEQRIKTLEEEAEAYRKAQTQLQERESQFRAIFNRSFQFALILDTSGTVLEQNDLCREVCGELAEGVLGAPLPRSAMVEGVPRNKKKTDKALQEVLRDEVVHDEVIFRDKDGRIREGSCIFSPIKDNTGAIKLISVVGLDTSEQKRTAAALAENERKYRNLVENLNDVVYSVDTDGIITHLSSPVKAVLGYQPAELIGQHFTEFAHPKEIAKIRQAFQDILRGKYYSNEYRVLSKNGEYRWVKTSSHVIKENGRVVGLQGVLADIHEQKTSAIALKASEERYRRLIETIPYGIEEIDLDGRMVFLNDASHHMLGYQPGDLVGKPIWYHNPTAEGAEEIKQNFERLKSEQPTPEPYISRNRTRDGRIIDIHVDWDYIRTENDTLKGFFSVVTDITKRKRAEDQLKWESVLNKAVADISRELMSFHYDVETVSKITLRYALELTQSTHGFVSSIDKQTLENVGHTLTDMFGKQCLLEDQRIAFPVSADGTYAGLWGHALNTKRPFFTNHPRSHPNSKGIPEGHIPLTSYLAVPVLIGDNIAGLIALANSERNYSGLDLDAIGRLADVFALALHRYRYETDREQMQTQVQQMQTLESIGNLAGGIAHDFNNLLFPIVGMSELLLEDLAPGSVEYENAKEVLAAGKRGRDLVRQILAFSRQSEHQPIPVRVQQILKEVLKLSRATIPSNIDISHNIQKNCGLVLADPTQLHQIAMNLITNAYHAVEPTEGKISLQLREVLFAEGDDAKEKRLPAGSYVMLSVADTGSGMPPHIAEKIFEPYFTTKEKGKGTGLGLAVVYGIVKELGGDIRFRSEPSKGTTFEVFLPLMQKVSDPLTTEVNGPLPSGDEKILLIDDEQPVVRLWSQILSRLGYRVTERTDSVQALKEFTSTPYAFDLVITDMAMPHLTGDKLAHELIAIRPNLPMIICTGYSERINRLKAAQMGIKGFLMKPVIRSEMAHLVRKLLDEATAKKG